LKQSVIEHNVKTGYRIEARVLSMIARLEAFTDMIEAFGDYDALLEDRRGAVRERGILDTVTDDQGIISVDTMSPELHEVLCLAHLACCCEMFDGWTFPMAALKQETLADAILEKIESGIAGNAQFLNRVREKLHSADAMRTMQLVRMLSLIEFDSTTCRQLSLGAGSGFKDIRSIHKKPVITRVSGGNNAPGQDAITLRAPDTRTEHVILVDVDENYADVYEHLNANNENILAFNDDANIVLDSLAKRMAGGKLDYRNFVANIRADHRMVTDVPAFFGKLAKVIEPVADYLVSIGAGSTDEDFAGRLQLMQAVFNHLRDCGLEPVWMKLAQGDTPAEIRSRPSFGYAPITTHEMLYCKLDRARLVT
jgi:hypothetical protein